MSRPILLLVALSCALAARALAADDPTRRGFDPDPARPALSLEGGFTSETAAAAPQGTFRIAAVFDVAGGLLALQQGSRREDLLVSRGRLQLLGGWSLGRIELAASLPIALWQGSDFSLLTAQGVAGPLVEPVASTTLGDLRLGTKVAILEASHWPIGLAALVDLRLPTGDPQAFMSDGLAAVPSLVATRMVGPVRVDVQVGYAIRKQGQYAQLVVHDGFVYSLGGSFDLPPLSGMRRWRAIVELNGGWQRGNDLSTARYRAPLSAWAGVRAFLSPQISFEAGLGTGLGEAGYGHERWRAFLGVRWGSQPIAHGKQGDRDGDGVPDDDDLCPDEPGPAELDGCPDRDGDGIPDHEDRCPGEPGPAENEGCPVPADHRVELESRRIALHDSIHFDTGKATIKRDSFGLLDEVAALIIKHPEFKRIRVEGHTDNVGSASYNKDLSAQRAASVLRHLIGKGVPPKRLESRGFGMERPIRSNATALGRAKNRRVVFVVLREGSVP